MEVSIATLKEMNAEEDRRRLREAREECFRNIAARKREREVKTPEEIETHNQVGSGRD